MIAGWPSPGGREEYAIACDRQRPLRLLVSPALFDEGNKTRHFTVETMRLLDRAGVDTFLPDLPGCNESLALLEEQDLVSWQEAMVAAAAHFSASHVLGIRAGALLAPPHLPGWRLAPLGGAGALRAMLRARILAAKEAGRTESREDLLERARQEGLELAGYRLGPAMIAQLADSDLPETAHGDLNQSELGGAGLWLRAEPVHDPRQATALAEIIAREIAT